MGLSVKAGKIQMRLCIIYRQPPYGQNRSKATMFLDEWSNYLDRLTIIHQEVILPSCSSDEHLANKFSDFFMRKITTSRDDIDNYKSPISDAVLMSADIKFEG